MTECPYAGNIVITDESQTFTNDSSRTVGTCVRFSCYTDFYIVGQETACCIDSPEGPKWSPGTGTCKFNESANDLGLVASGIQLSEVGCTGVVGALGGAAGVSLIILFATVLCCIFARQKRKYLGYQGENVVENRVIHEYGPQKTVYQHDVRHISQPPSYNSKPQQWPTGGTEYPLYAGSQHQPPHRREVVDYERTRNVEDVKPNLWLTYAESLEGDRRSYRNRSYEPYDEDRDVVYREKYARRW